MLKVSPNTLNRQVKLHLFYAMKNQEINTILSKIGLTWRTAYIVYKDNNTYLYSVKQHSNKTKYTFTNNIFNSKIFEDFEPAYSLVCVYNTASWVIDNNIKPNRKSTYKLFVTPVQIKGRKTKQIKTLQNNPIIQPWCPLPCISFP